MSSCSCIGLLVETCVGLLEVDVTPGFSPLLQAHRENIKMTVITVKITLFIFAPLGFDLENTHNEV
jgi:hypothetical protein